MDKIAYDKGNEGVIADVVNNYSDTQGLDKFASPEEKIALFRSLFRGREDVYTKGYISLPLQGDVRKDEKTVFVDESFAPYIDQRAYLRGRRQSKNSRNSFKDAAFS